MIYVTDRLIHPYYTSGDWSISKLLLERGGLRYTKKYCDWGSWTPLPGGRGLHRDMEDIFRFVTGHEYGIVRATH